MEILRFENPEYFYLLALIPLFVAIFIARLVFRRKNMKKLGQMHLVNQMMPMRSVHRPWLKLILFLLAFASLVMAAVNPQIGTKMEDPTNQGVDIVIALDVSRSMLAEDIKPNRIERAKLAVSNIINRLENDRIGIVVFAATAITQVPMTSDHEAAQMILRTINTNSVQKQGTAIGAAIERSMSAFIDRGARSRVIILISDGENHEDDPIYAAQKAHEEGFVIHTVGVGSPQGAPIPIYEGNTLKGFFRDQEGNTVISRFDDNLMRGIAQAGGGIFQSNTGPDMGLNRILDEIRGMEQHAIETAAYAEYESRFQYFIALALFFILLEFIIFERRSKWLNSIRLFSPNNNFSK